VNNVDLTSYDQVDGHPCYSHATKIFEMRKISTGKLCWKINAVLLNV